ncbi:MAG TPA: PaaI family thioesterase [Myxococcales bacterium]|nr:PaaI family thioesterase [Myxococcales bacterium]
MPLEDDVPARPPPPREALERYAQAFNESQLLAGLSARLTFPDPPDRVVVRVDPILPFHRGGLGTSAVNGGILAAMFDFVIGVTAALIDPTRRSATMQLSITFERPVTGDWFLAEGRIDRAGGSILFSSAVVKDPLGQVCSRCAGLVRLSKLPWDPNWQNQK